MGKRETVALQSLCVCARSHYAIYKIILFFSFSFPYNSNMQYFACIIFFKQSTLLLIRAKALTQLQRHKTQLTPYILEATTV